MRLGDFPLNGGAVASTDATYVGPVWVIKVISSASHALPLYPRFQTYFCHAENEVQGPHPDSCTQQQTLVCSTASSRELHDSELY